MHQPVHQERGADHVAGAFEQENKEEQDQDLRQEGDHRTDAGDRSVDHRGAQQPRRKRNAGLRRQPRHQILDPRNRRLAPGEHGLEHDEHDCSEDERAEEGMEQRGIETVGPAANRGFADDCRSGDFASPALEVDEVAFDQGMNPAERRGKHVVQGAVQLGKAAAADRDRFDNGHAKLPLKHFGVELKSVALGKIDHVERDDRRQSKLDELQREAEVIVEVGGVEDDDQGVGLALALLLAEQHIASDRFVGACRLETVGAGQVDELDRAPVRQH